MKTVLLTSDEPARCLEINSIEYHDIVGPNNLM